jgi:hypothetical protein
MESKESKCVDWLKDPKFIDLLKEAALYPPPTPEQKAIMQHNKKLTEEFGNGDDDEKGGVDDRCEQASAVMEKYG